MKSRTSSCVFRKQYRNLPQDKPTLRVSDQYDLVVLRRSGTHEGVVGKVEIGRRNVHAGELKTFRIRSREYLLKPSVQSLRAEKSRLLDARVRVEKEIGSLPPVVLGPLRGLTRKVDPGATWLSHEAVDKNHDPLRSVVSREQRERIRRPEIARQKSENMRVVDFAHR